MYLTLPLLLRSDDSLFLRRPHTFRKCFLTKARAHFEMLVIYFRILSFGSCKRLFIRQVIRNIVIIEAYKLPILNGIKYGDALSPLLLNFVLEYAITKVQESHEALKLNETFHFLVDADGVNLQGQSLLAASTQAGLEVNTEKTECTFTSC
jgi:hypothetical protein